MSEKQAAFEKACAALEAAWAEAMDHLNRPAPKNDLAINQNAAHAERIYLTATRALEQTVADLQVEIRAEDYSADCGCSNKAEFRCDVHANHDRLWGARERNLCLIAAVTQGQARRAQAGNV